MGNIDCGYETTETTETEHRTLRALKERRVIRRNASEAALARAERNAKAHSVSRPLGEEVEVSLQGDYNTAKAALFQHGPVVNIRPKTKWVNGFKEVTLVANLK